MSRFRWPFILLLLSVCVMPLTVYQPGLVNAYDRPSDPGDRNRPTVNEPTDRPTANVPTERPTESFSRSFDTGSITRSFASSFDTSRWTSFSRTIVTTTNPTFSWTITLNYNWPTWGSFIFNQYPPDYNPTAGSFTLNQVLKNQNGAPCLYYASFTFNANAGQQLQAQVWTQGAPISYVIVPSGMLNALQQSGCNYGNFGQAQTFSSQVSVNWTAPQNGEVAIIFYSTTTYTGPVYFTLG